MDVNIPSDLVDTRRSLDVHQAFNTGICAFRKTVNTYRFLRDWKARIINTTGGNDQSEFNLLVYDQYDASGQIRRRRPTFGMPDNTSLVYRRRLLLHMLPSDRFVNGHTYFMQDVRRNAVALHMTYVYGGLASKIERLRSVQLWRVATEASNSTLEIVNLRSFLAQRILEATRSYPSATWSCKADEPVSQLFDDHKRCFHPRHVVTKPERDSRDPDHVHLMLQEWTRRILRNALELAYSTGRDLVVPTFWCG